MLAKSITKRGEKRKRNPRRHRKSHKAQRRPERHQLRREEIRRRRHRHRANRRGVGPPQSLLRKLIAPMRQAIASAVARDKEESWFPRLSVLAHILCGLSYHLFGMASLRATVEKVNNTPELGIGTIPLSTLADAMNSPRRLKVLRQVFANLLLGFAEHVPRKLQRFKDIAAIDSTIIHCVLSAVWADYRKAIRACKLHLVLDLAKGLPKALVVSAAKVHDRKCFEMFLKKGWTYIVDRGYIVYAVFDQMIDAEIFFITRMKKDAAFRVVTSKRVKRKHRKMGIISDQIIQLGVGAAEMIHEVRLVVFKAENGEVYEYLTNRLDLAPTSIAALYKARWSIELFFKFFKRTLRGVRPLARSEAGAEIHILLTLMCDIVLKCMAKALGRWSPGMRHVPVTFLRSVRDYLLTIVSHRLEVLLAQALL